MRITYIAILLMLAASHARAQFLVGLHSVWDDSFREWTIVTTEDDSTYIEGDLQITWGIGNDFRTYDFRMGELSGEVKQVFPKDPSNWQLRLGNELVSLRQVWPNDPTEWKISTANRQFVLKTRYRNMIDEWQLKDEKHGELYIYTDMPGDVRDWVVDDYLVDDIPFSMKLAAAFVAVHVSTPKL